MRPIWLAASLCALCAHADPLKIRLNPSGTSATRPDPDYTLWTVANAASASSSFGDVSLSLSAPGGSVLKGAAYKFVFTRFTDFLGERVIAEGISTDTTTGQPITLSVKGLSAGNHTLLIFHNAWDALPGATPISIAVNGQTVISSQNQTVRVDNIWQAASSYISFPVNSSSETVNVTYTPVNSSLSDIRAFLNGLEFDTPDIDKQVSFPFPQHTDEHVDADSGSFEASWTPPKAVSNAKYDVYFAENTTNLTTVSSGQSSDSFTFSNLSSLKTYTWRVDTISESGEVTTGRVWTFRPRQLAFPGAEGYGRFARGGRDGQIVKVTSLDDYDPTGAPVEGTLRYAVTAVSGPRTIVFDIGGVITLTSRLTINEDYITIAGQTAPGKGIAIQGWPMGLSGASDVIIRHMRVRPGKVSNQTIDGMGMQGSNHAIFDRCSMGWAIDECFSSRSAFNITLQRSMISEPLNVAGHKNYPPGTMHGFAASIGGDVGSFHHNLIAHAYGRSWSMAGGADANGAFAGQLDLRNNVVYNFGGRVTDGGSHHANFVSNNYRPGPNSSIHFDMMAQYEDGLPGTQQYYCSGNSMFGWFDQNTTQVVTPPAGQNQSQVVGPCWANVSIDPPPTYQKFFDDPFFESFVETQSSTEAYKRVLSDAGAQYPVQDQHDTRIINETVTNTTTYVGSVTGFLGIIDDPKDVGGLEDFPTTTRDEAWDADGDGIADWWDGSNGGDDGWTALDGYLNFMADPHVFVSPGGQVEIDLKPLSAGFVEPSFELSAGKGSVSVDGSTATYSAPEDAGIDTVELDISDSEGSSWSRTIGVAIFEGASET